MHRIYRIYVHILLKNDGGELAVAKLFDCLRRLKRRLGMYVQHSRILKGMATDINFVFFHWNMRQRDAHLGELNPGVKFYVIRSSGEDQGLLSIYLGNLRLINEVIHSGFVPIVDYETTKTQYNISSQVNGTHNAWEYYFEQPCRYSLEEVYRSRNVRLSGWRFFQAYSVKKPGAKRMLTREMMDIAPVKQYVYDLAAKKVKSNGISDMIGLLVRGTDYTKLRPSGHPVSPSPEQAAEKLDEFLAMYGRRRIFLATEDAEIYDFFMARYGDLLYTSDNNLVRGYSGRDYIANEIHNVNKYQFGLDYLVKMICLSECRYLIASRTSGTSFARLLNAGRYLDEYIFDLGVY